MGDVIDQRDRFALRPVEQPADAKLQIWTCRSDIAPGKECQSQSWTIKSDGSVSCEKCGWVSRIKAFLPYEQSP